MFISKNKVKSYKILIQPNLFPVYFVLVGFLLYLGFFWFFLRHYLLYAIIFYYVIANLILYRTLKKNENKIVFDDHNVEIRYHEKLIKKDNIDYFSTSTIYALLHQNLYKIVEDMKINPEEVRKRVKLVLYLKEDVQPLCDGIIYLKGRKYYPLIININSKKYNEIVEKLKKVGIKEINSSNLREFLV